MNESSRLGATGNGSENYVSGVFDEESMQLFHRRHTIDNSTHILDHLQTTDHLEYPFADESVQQLIRKLDDPQLGHQYRTLPSHHQNFGAKHAQEPEKTSTLRRGEENQVMASTVDRIQEPSKPSGLLSPVKKFNLNALPVKGGTSAENMKQMKISNFQIKSTKHQADNPFECNQGESFYDEEMPPRLNLIDPARYSHIENQLLSENYVSA